MLVLSETVLVLVIESRQALTDRVANVDESSQQISKHRLMVCKTSFGAMELLDRLVQSFGPTTSHQTHRVERVFVGVDTPVIDRQDARVL